MENTEQGSSMAALVIDDEKSIRETLAGVLSDEGWRPILAKNGREGISRFGREKPNIVLLDVWMNGMDGIEVLQKMKEIDEQVPVVIMSGHSTIETAVKATKLGAFDFLEKPLSLDKLLPLLEHVREYRPVKIAEYEEGVTEKFIGRSPIIERIKRQISLVAPKNSWVLITGENGTGKEVVAKRLHMLSPRAKKPFIAVNCAAIPESLIESELFGHVKGSFTNAIRDKPGKFELAHQGTLFLDEIGDMSIKTQAKILRILQDQKFERVGDTETLQVDVRVIAATNKDLREEMKKGFFREDLYYRLNVVPFHLPPLRDRAADILDLARYFLGKISSELGEPTKRLLADGERILLHHHWLGNVRELRNVLERACILVPGDEIGAEDLTSLLEPQDEEERNGIGQDLLVNEFLGGQTLREAKSDFEKAFILGKLEENQWNVTKTAEAIGLERSHLHRKLKGFDIDPKQLRG